MKKILLSLIACVALQSPVSATPGLKETVDNVVLIFAGSSIACIGSYLAFKGCYHAYTGLYEKSRFPEAEENKGQQQQLPRDARIACAKVGCLGIATMLVGISIALDHGR